MGLLQRALETYDANQRRIGEYHEGQEPLAPIGHTLTNADIEITLNRDGGFVTARIVDKSEPKILIPVTEASSGRTSALVAHPLCDNLKYIADLNAEAHKLYVEAIGSWTESAYTHPFLQAVHAYVRSGAVLRDLQNAGCLDGDPKKNEKQMICWRVIGVDGEEPACWKNQNLFRAFEDYYLDSLSTRGKMLCMLEGHSAPLALQHPKGIVAVNGNAKLISANDSSGFTYRGRFTEDWQAASVGYIASQKAHNALHWLASEQGVRECSGKRIFICWNPQGKKIPRPMRRARGNDSPPVYSPSDYQKALQNTLLGLRQDQKLKDGDVAILAAFDAATAGRLALTYYNEISLGTFLDRIQAWDAHCCWYAGKFGIQAPNLIQIVECAYGTQRGNFLETDNRIERQHMQRLLNCKIGGGVFPVDIVKALTQRASTPMAYDEAVWRRIMHAACSALQKYRYDTRIGGNEMAWELDKRNRSFQYGRLLAAMDRAEADYYFITKETRQTNAIRFMAEYRQRPLTVFERINRHLQQAYLTRILPRQAKRYTRLVDEIFSILREFPEKDLNAPLEDLYLMGYELQRNAFFTQKEQDTETEA